MLDQEAEEGVISLGSPQDARVGQAVVKPALVFGDGDQQEPNAHHETIDHVPDDAQHSALPADRRLPIRAEHPQSENLLSRRRTPYSPEIYGVHDRQQKAHRPTDDRQEKDPRRSFHEPHRPSPLREPEGPHAGRDHHG